MRPHAPWLRPLAAFLVLLSLLGPASGAIPDGTSTTSNQGLTSLLREGSDHERSRQWAKAIEVYEEGLRRWPGDRVLDQRLDACKVHARLSRRYSDLSFRHSLLRLPREQAFRLYNETLLQVQTRYVDSLALSRLVRRGTENLKIAVEDPEFVRSNLPGRSKENVSRFQQELTRQVGTLSITDRRDAHDAVRRACDLGRTWLGMAEAPVVMEYVFGACEALDPHSSYLTPDQLTDLRGQIDGSFVGLGVELRKDDDDLMIVRVLPESPANEGGLRAGDVIVAIGGQPTAPMSLDRAANRLGGKSGSIVTINVLSRGAAASRSVTMRRRAVDVKSITASRIVDRPYRIAYIQLSGFQKTTAAELNAALWKLHRQGMRFLILDLRGNPGGLLTSAVEVSDRFVKRGTIVSTRGRSAGENWAYSAHEAGTWGVPMAVLVDEDSASASEIVAACIRDNRRGKIVGRKTYGKGSVQSIYELQSVRSGLRLTTAKFFSPHGRALDHVGVQPDVLVGRSGFRGLTQPAPGQEKDPSDDPEMNAALRVARQQLAGRRPAVVPSRSSFESRRRLPSR